MVDFQTYKQLYSDSKAFKKAYPFIDNTINERMEDSISDAEEPPTSPEIYVFPDSIPAYNIRSKKWGMYKHFIDTYSL